MTSENEPKGEVDARLLVPALWLFHTPFLRRLIRVARFGDRVYVDWRWPWEGDGGPFAKNPKGGV